MLAWLGGQHVLNALSTTHCQQTVTYWLMTDKTALSGSAETKTDCSFCPVCRTLYMAPPSCPAHKRFRVSQMLTRGTCGPSATGIAGHSAESGVPHLHHIGRELIDMLDRRSAPHPCGGSCIGVSSGPRRRSDASGRTQ